MSYEQLLNPGSGDLPYPVPNPEVSLKAKRRIFSAEYKPRILNEASACRTSGERGALLRREGLCSSHLTHWRRELRDSALNGLQPKKRGPKSDPLTVENEKLRREVARLQARLERAETIFEVPRKIHDGYSHQDVATLARVRAADTRRDAPEQRLAAANELAKHLPVGDACGAVGLLRSTFYRLLANGVGTQPRVLVPLPKPKPPSPRALSVQEQATVLDLLNSERFQDQAPRAVYATLLDEGIYVCHWNSMYRLLAENQQVSERRHQLVHPPSAKPELVATAPNQVWSWDIPKLLGPGKHTCYYLYVILDGYSR